MYQQSKFGIPTLKQYKIYALDTIFLEQGSEDKVKITVTPETVCDTLRPQGVSYMLCPLKEETKKQQHSLRNDLFNVLLVFTLQRISVTRCLHQISYKFEILGQHNAVLVIGLK